MLKIKKIFIISFLSTVCLGPLNFAFDQVNESKKVTIQVDSEDNINFLPLSKDLSGCSQVLIEPHENEFCDPYCIENEAYEAYEVEVFRLKNLQPAEIPIKSLSLYAVIKLCSEAANMNYLAPDKEEFSETISLNVQASPYELLKILAETYCFGMEYKLGIWRFYRFNIHELITRNYKLKYNTNEVFQTISPNIKPNVSNQNESSRASNSKEGMSVFIKQKDEITEIVRKILDMPSTSLIANIDSSIDVDTLEGKKEPLFVPKPSKNNLISKGNFYFASDNNELVVTATRQQHSMIEQYLKAIDKPQKLIKIQALIVETSKNPKKDLGIDWSQIGHATFQLKTDKNKDNTLGDVFKVNILPTATLSTRDMAIALNFLESDRETCILQDPVVVTSNNREVTLKSVTQQPVELGRSNSTTFSTNNTSNSIGYIEIGTLINIYPKILAGGLQGYDKEAIRMDISIVISSQVGAQEINRNSFPIVSSRTYTYSVVVPSGHTLAIGGLSECNYSTKQTRLPILGELPFIGSLFRSKSETKDKRNLLAFITPNIIDNSLNEEIKALNKLENNNFEYKAFETLNQIQKKFYN